MYVIEVANQLAIGGYTLLLYYTLFLLQIILLLAM